MAARLVSIQVGLPRIFGAEQGFRPDRAWSSAIIKEPVTGPVWLGELNLDGDRQDDLQAHGGPDQSVLGYAAAHYPHWRAELERPDLPHGAFGENFTIEGLDEDSVSLGDTFEVGEVVIQVTSPRGPCWKIAMRHRISTLTARVEELGWTGWYHRTLQQGYVEAGQELRLVARPHPEWTVRRLAETLRGRDAEAMRELAAIPELGARFRNGLYHRLARLDAA
ncbi:MAG TPA: MOSC domain-containing protein [Thermomicrobiales bacterium]|nr:MOSC domain-containing protein [Thermomicrobiales bacterium]